MHPRRPMPKILAQPFLALGCTTTGIPFGSDCPLTDPELFALQTKYGEKYAVCPRTMYVGTQDWPSMERNNPKLELLYDSGAGQPRSQNADSLLLSGSIES